MVDGKDIALTARDCVLFSTADWDEPYWTNKQHTASILAARGWRILYVESVGFRSPKVGSGRDWKRLWRRLWRGVQSLVLGPPHRAQNVWVLSPLMVPAGHHLPFVRALNQALLRFSVTRFAKSQHFNKPVVWTYHPYMLEAIADAAARAARVSLRRRYRGDSGCRRRGVPQRAAGAARPLRGGVHDCDVAEGNLLAVQPQHAFLRQRGGRRAFRRRTRRRAAARRACRDPRAAARVSRRAVGLQGRLPAVAADRAGAAALAVDHHRRGAGRAAQRDCSRNWRACRTCICSAIALIGSCRSICAACRSACCRRC